MSHYLNLYNLLLFFRITPPYWLAKKLSDHDKTQLLQIVTHNESPTLLRLILKSFEYDLTPAYYKFTPFHIKTISSYVARLNRGYTLISYLFRDRNKNINYSDANRQTQTYLNNIFAQALNNSNYALIRILNRDGFRVDKISANTIKNAFIKKSFNLLHYLATYYQKNNRRILADNLLQQAIIHCTGSELKEIYYQYIYDFASASNTTELYIHIKKATCFAIYYKKYDTLDYLAKNQNDVCHISEDSWKAILNYAIRRKRYQAISQILKTIPYNINIFHSIYVKAKNQFLADYDRDAYYMVCNICEIEKQRATHQAGYSTGAAWRELQCYSKDVQDFMRKELAPCLQDSIENKTKQTTPLELCKMVVEYSHGNIDNPIRFKL